MSIPTADHALLVMWTRLMADDTMVPVAESLRALCDEWLDGPARSAEMAVIITRLTDAHPEHADRILAEAMNTGI